MYNSGRWRYGMPTIIYAGDETRAKFEKKKKKKAERKEDKKKKLTSRLKKELREKAIQANEHVCPID